jgi:hypothetical protein
VAIVIRPAVAADWDGYVRAFESVAAEGRWLGRELPIDWEPLRERSPGGPPG